MWWGRPAAAAQGWQAGQTCGKAHGQAFRTSHIERAPHPRRRPFLLCTRGANEASVRPMTANKMWGGRFERGPAGIMEEINVSVDFDKRLADHDIAGSKAHARMLAAQGIISQADADAISGGLDQIAADIVAGKFEFKRELEDIH